MDVGVAKHPRASLHHGDTGLHLLRRNGITSDLCHGAAPSDHDFRIIVHRPPHKRRRDRIESHAGPVNTARVQTQTPFASSVLLPQAYSGSQL